MLDATQEAPRWKAQFEEMLAAIESQDLDEDAREAALTIGLRMVQLTLLEHLVERVECVADALAGLQL